jgi:hypothetical protein
MKFIVNYLDRDALNKDIYNYMISTNKIISPHDRSWGDYFRIQKKIETEKYNIAYYDDNSKPGKLSLGITHFLVIEVGGEIVFVDSMMLMIQDGQMKGDTFLEKIDNIFNKGIITEHCYSWDSIIERIKILNIHKDYKYLEIDKILKRDSKIEQLLK